MRAAGQLATSCKLARGVRVLQLKHPTFRTRLSQICDSHNPKCPTGKEAKMSLVQDLMNDQADRAEWVVRQRQAAFGDLSRREWLELQGYPPRRTLPRSWGMLLGGIAGGTVGLIIAVIAGWH